MTQGVGRRDLRDFKNQRRSQGSSISHLTVLLEELDLARLAISLDGAREALVERRWRELDLDKSPRPREYDSFQKL